MKAITKMMRLFIPKQESYVKPAMTIKQEIADRHENHSQALEEVNQRMNKIERDLIEVKMETKRK